MEVVPFGGWNRCARLVSGDVEAIITLEVGPRVIRYGLIGGPNELAAYERHAGMIGGDTYRSYGGHRLWTAPEIAERTYEADNEPVGIEERDGWLVLTTPLGPTGLQKQLSLKVGDASTPSLVLHHAITNRTSNPVVIAPWCVTVMAPGGTCITPQPVRASHPDALLPGGPIALWRYTRMQDRRWTWGDNVIRLQQDSSLGPQKFGACIEQGAAVYANHGNVFLKRFAHDPIATYPDCGCNFEAFTREDMLEVETLGPLRELLPGQCVEHRETWYLLEDVRPPADDAACGVWMASLADQHAFSQD